MDVHAEQTYTSASHAMKVHDTVKITIHMLIATCQVRHDYTIVRHI